MPLVVQRCDPPEAINVIRGGFLTAQAWPQEQQLFIWLAFVLLVFGVKERNKRASCRVKQHVLQGAVKSARILRERMSMKLRDVTFLLL